MIIVLAPLFALLAVLGGIGVGGKVSDLAGNAGVGFLAVGAIWLACAWTFDRIIQAETDAWDRSHRRSGRSRP